VRVAVPTQDGGPGSTFEFHREGGHVTVTPHAAAPGWSVLFVGETVESASGGTVEAAADGSLVLPTSIDGTVTLTLRAAR